MTSLSLSICEDSPASALNFPTLNSPCSVAIVSGEEVLMTCIVYSYLTLLLVFPSFYLGNHKLVDFFRSSLLRRDSASLALSLLKGSYACLKEAPLSNFMTRCPCPGFLSVV